MPPPTRPSDLSEERSALPTSWPPPVVDLAAALHESASAAFFHGFEVACLVAAAVAIVGSVAAMVLIPAQPPRVSTEGNPRPRGGFGGARGRVPSY